MRLKLIAVVVLALAGGTGVGLVAGGGGEPAAVKEASLPGKAGKGKAVRVAGLKPAARIPTLVKVRTARQTVRQTFTQQTQIRTQTQVQTQTQQPPRPTVDPDPSE